jgi:hypothetical protein
MGVVAQSSTVGSSPGRYVFFHAHLSGLNGCAIRRIDAACNHAVRQDLSAETIHNTVSLAWRVTCLFCGRGAMRRTITILLAMLIVAAGAALPMFCCAPMPQISGNCPCHQTDSSSMPCYAVQTPGCVDTGCAVDRAVPNALAARRVYVTSASRDLASVLPELQQPLPLPTVRFDRSESFGSSPFSSARLYLRLHLLLV